MMDLTNRGCDDSDKAQQDTIRFQPSITEDLVSKPVPQLACEIRKRGPDTIRFRPSINEDVISQLVPQLACGIRKRDPGHQSVGGQNLVKRYRETTVSSKMSAPQLQGDIAVIGMGCRFPGDGKSPAEFYEMLLKKRSGWTEVPKDRFNVNSFWHPSYERHGAIVCKGGHFMRDDVGLFDAPFFSMTQGEANAMDPQQRMLLEITYEALENAGLPLGKVVGSDTACFIGGFTREYDDVATSELAKTLLYTTTGNGLTMMSNRLSWFFDLHGPSVSLDTACSSSLVALNLACQAIRGSTSNSRQAIVGGVNLILSPDQMTTMNPLHFLSPDSQCYSFDDRANGYTRGEGIGIIVLKHIDDAIRDEDCIRAVIRGTGINSDGKTPGITLPSTAAQASLIRQTYASAGLDPAQTGYFEAHGTGTGAGDPLEVSAIGSVFVRTTKDSPAPLYIGSVKPNIGHLEAGAGLAGLIKTVLTLETGVIPPNINFVNANPKLRLEDYNFIVPTQPTAWPTQCLRRASVNSFGYGGTNSHCIIDDAYHYLAERGIMGRTHTVKYPLVESPDSVSADSGVDMEEIGDDSQNFSKSNSHPPQKLLFALSAPEQNALSRLGETLASYVDGIDSSKHARTESFLEQLAFTLSNRRTKFQWRTVVIAEQTEDLERQLRNVAKPARASKTPTMLFCFTGQGAQWYAMGRELLAHEVYKASLHNADSYLKDIGASWSVLGELNMSQDNSRIGKPEYSQPLCTVLQVALVDLLKHWNIRPTIVTGHSSGEIAAAYAMGALSAKDSWKIAFHRGRLAGNLHVIAPQLKGGMTAVGLSEADIKPYLKKIIAPYSDVLSVACINSPSNVTVSGDMARLSELETLLKADSVFVRRLAVENAYHSSHMRYLADDYLKSIEDVKPISRTESASDVTMISSVTGKTVQREDLQPAYWVNNMVSPVQFVSAIENAIATPKGGRRKKSSAIDVVVEIGPHAALQGPIKQTLTHIKKIEEATYLTAIRREEPADRTALQLACALWSRGADVRLELTNSLKSTPPLFVPLCDMPKYPWNHETRYWHEAAPSKSHRFRHAPRTDLLGYPVQEFSMLEPQWKNILYVSELPWISDHKVRGNEVFPAAGMVCAALEGARQIADKSRVVDNFEFRDISIARALLIPPSDPGVDVFTRLNPQKSEHLRLDMSPWYEFTFSSLEAPETKSSKYVQHARGFVAINYRSESSEIFNTPNEYSAEAARTKKEYEDVKSSSQVDVSKAMHYANNVEMGFDYGPTFQGLTSAKIGHGQASFTIEITDTAAIMPAQFEYEHLLHPSTLDAAMQSASQAMRMSTGKLSESMVPTGFERLRVSAEMPKGANTQLVGFSKARRTGYRDNTATVMISDLLWERTMLEIYNLGFTGLGDNNDQIIDDDQAVAMRKMCSEVHWKADIDLLDSEKDHPQLLCGQGVEAPEKLDEWGVVATKATAILTKRALSSLTPEVEHNLPAPHFRHFVQWMRDKYREMESGKLDYQDGADWAHMSVEEEEKIIATYIEKYPEDGLLVTAIGRNLPAILRGTVEPLQIMLQNDMLTTIYARSPSLRSGLTMFKEWFDLQGHKYPDMKVLEVGAGTGSVTLPILHVLGGSGGRTPRFGSYCFTDISTGWFEKAQELLKPWQGLIEFKKLNIEEDVLEQGFDAHSFDVIAASNVLHATKRMDITLANCYKLLKPGGRLVIGELTYSQDHIGLVFGTLPGWWMSEDGRKGGPLMTEVEWRRRLQSSGYLGLDMAVGAKDTLGDAKLSMMVSSKPIINTATILQQMVIIEPSLRSHVGVEVAAALKEVFSDISLQFVDLRAAASRATAGEFLKPGLSVISLLETDEHVFARCSKDSFEAIRKVILHSTKLLWVTCHASKDGVRSPESCAISGLFRAAKSENRRLFLQELHLQKRDRSKSADVAKIVGQVVKSTWAADKHAEYEDEIFEVDGVLMIPRLTDEEHLNRMLQTIGVAPQPEPQPLSSITRPLALAVGKPGLLDTLHFVDNVTVLESLAVDEILIDVKAAALNQDDVMVALGQMPSLALGYDGAGYVKQTGSSVTAVKAGDMVAFAAPGAISTLVRVKGDLVHILPKGMSLEDGASIPLVFMAAYQSLMETARLSPGERVLIHSAAGGLGQAMIQIAQHVRAEIFVTVSTTDKCDLMKGYGIKADHIFNSHDLSFTKGINRMTNGKGADVIINTLTGEALRQTWACISPFGRFVQLGKKDVLANSGLDMKFFSANVSFSMVNMQDICRTATAKAAALLTKVFNLFRLGALKVVHPLTVFDYSKVQTAFRTMQNGLHTGKLVLKASEHSVIPALPHDAHPLKLRPHATYVLAGGLGGLGRGLAIYLAEHGAKHLAFFTRTNEVRPAARKILDQLKEREVEAKLYVCDVTDAEALERTIARIGSEMPPIKGVVQGAMVLRDGLFETMSYENWVEATAPKVQGSWNLHELMPHDLDFFIMLSSLAGILGNRGQSNYCAGNTYQDQLAYYRRSLGLPGQVVDLGAIEGLGWFEENKQALKFAETVQNLIVRAEEFYALMKSAMTGYSRGGNRVPTQIIIGVGSGGLNKANRAAGSQTDYYWLNESPRMSYLRRLDLHSTLQAEEGDEMGELKGSLTAVSTLVQATNLIQNVVASKLAKSMMIAIEEINVDRPVSSYGVDSLVAAEMRNWCFRDLKADISIFELLSGNSITVLAGQIANRSALVPQGIEK
ncbi:MAG: hypothetical protein Q9163_001490 [Psora crenata]